MDNSRRRMIIKIGEIASGEAGGGKRKGKPKVVPEPVRPVREVLRAGRNDPCPCKSGKKYKNCCRGR